MHTTNDYSPKLNMVANNHVMHHKLPVSHENPSMSPSPLLAEQGCMNDVLFLSMSLRLSSSINSTGDSAG